MESFSSTKISNKEVCTRDMSIILSMLEAGHSVELPATGYSMFPTFMPGDKIIVKPFEKEELPELGNVVVYKENEFLVMHRLVSFAEGESGETLFISHGDSLLEQDKPWPQWQLIGLAVNYKRGQKERIIKKFIPGTWKYMCNFSLLWILNKFKKLNRVAGKLVESK